MIIMLKYENRQATIASAVFCCGKGEQMDREIAGELMRSVNILGTAYQIFINVDPETMPENADGCIDQTTRVIKIAKMEKDRDSVQNLVAYKDKILRHEIVHAFFYESGLWANSGQSDAWGQDEAITDWFAIQSPKIFKAFKEAGCL